MKKGSMCPKNGSKPKADDQTFEVSQNLDGLTLELDSCYRGRLEIWKDRKGEIVKVDIIR